MDPLLVVGLGLAGMFLLIALHVPVGVAMGATGLVCFWLLDGDFNLAFSILKTETQGALSSLELAVIPLFLLMGGFATAAGMSTDLYRLAQSWLGHLRGGLALATIGACAGFGAVCGSSIATTATMTKVALPEMRARGYAARLAAGAIAGGGSLGMLIPPSILMVLYAILTEQSVLSMFAGAVVPGVLAVLLYMAAIAVHVRLFPAAAPRSERQPWRDRLQASARSWRVVALAFVVSAGIYGGAFTVSEAAAVGGALAFLFYLVGRGRSRASLLEVLGDTAGTTAMLFVVIIGASTMSYFVTISGAPGAIVDWIRDLGLPPLGVIAILAVMFVFLGSVFDTTAGMVITLPFVYPLILELGYDPIWWGLVMIVLIEVGMITPPIGLNVFVLHGMAPDLPLGEIFRGIVPFLIADILRLVLLILFPQLVLWLPGLLGLGSYY
ncbi:TRAP transporter large permease [Marinibaculum pumilum]|uniref:TRAP transporter large permease protein n=1 Tax=Marinibaculum pumilum TaxID=1766165 RepID=A0ABV7L1P0_9PROT